MPQQVYCLIFVIGGPILVFGGARRSLPCVQALKKWIFFHFYVVCFGISEGILKPVSLTGQFGTLVVIAEYLSKGPVRKHV